MRATLLPWMNYIFAGTELAVQASAVCRATTATRMNLLAQNAMFDAEYLYDGGGGRGLECCF